MITLTGITSVLTVTHARAYKRGAVVDSVSISSRPSDSFVVARGVEVLTNGNT